MIVLRGTFGLDVRVGGFYNLRTLDYGGCSTLRDGARTVRVPSALAAVAPWSAFARLRCSCAIQIGCLRFFVASMPSTTFTVTLLVL